MIRGVRSSATGFTLVETIVVLAIMVALLSSALLLFRERVPRTQFENAVNEFQLQLSDISNQVATGYYPGSDNYDCAPGPVLSVGTGEKGQNADCIFVGQAVQFGLQKSGCSVPAPKDNCDTMVYYTVYGNRKSSSSTVATNITDSNAQISEDLAQSTYTTGYGLHVTSVKVNGVSPVGGIAFLQSFGSSLSGAGNAEGASQILVIPLKTTDVGQTKASFAAATDVTTPLEGLLTTPADEDGIKICLRSGTTGQYAAITLGANGSSTITDKRIFEDVTSWNAEGCS